MKSKKNFFNKIVLFLYILGIITVIPLNACSLQPSTGQKEKLTIFAAGSLAMPFEKINREFEHLNPEVRVFMETSGSATAIRKLTELGKPCGIIGSADYRLIEELMFPEYADWYIVFASNEIVIAYTDKSRHAEEIKAHNWFEVLQRKGVRYGRSDPDQDPCGYRTLMLWQLAQRYYQVPGLYRTLYGAEGDLVRSRSVELISLLQSGDLDYAFEYLSIARQYNLNYITLPLEINLSSVQYKDYYALARVNLRGAQPGQEVTLEGSPIVYAFTIPGNSTEKSQAIKWAELLLSQRGKQILLENFLSPVSPAKTNDVLRLPVQLREYVR